MMNTKSTLKGFTLLEVMIALAIIAIGVSSILESMAWDAVIPYERRIRYKAVQLAELKMNDVEIDIKKNGFPLDNVEHKGDFSDIGLPNFYWIDRRKKIEIPDDIGMLTNLFMGPQSEDGEQQNQMSGMGAFIGPVIQQIKDLFEKGIREVEIEIYWYDGDPDEKSSRESFILTTHLIDFKNIGL